jgi:hypothetical protein
MQFFQEKYWFVSAILVTIIAYILLGYFVPRENFVLLFSCYSCAFLALILIMQNEKISDKQLFSIGLLFRAIFIFGIPFWSQDFYRFIWDGRLLASGFNPFIYLPNDIVATTSISQAHELFEGMGSLSAQHYSNYPPVNQFLFSIAAYLSSKSIFFSVFIFKIVIILGDVGIYFYGKKLLQQIGLSTKRIFWYFLNPLVIIELTGNLHFEGVMLFFFIVGLFFFFAEKWKMGAVFIGLSIATKLLPLLLLPFFFQKLRFNKSIVFYSIVIGLNVLLFLPFFSTTLISNYTETIGLWFTNFEFNASIYYIVRELGFLIKGYNVIGIVGKITPIVAIVVVCYFALFRNNKTPQKLFSNMLLALAVYFFISTTVHPWYIVNLVLLSIFTKYKFPLYWSYVVVLSYFAYSNLDFKENNYLLTIEYLLVFGIFVYEIVASNKKLTNE